MTGVWRIQFLSSVAAAGICGDEKGMFSGIALKGYGKVVVFGVREGITMAWTLGYGNVFTFLHVAIPRTQAHCYIVIVL